jgi:hypothetical protein
MLNDAENEVESLKIEVNEKESGLKHAILKSIL